MGKLIFVVALALYATGAWKFWTGFNRTEFSTGKAYLTLLWPAFMITNPSYRRNFSKALKGK